MALASQLSLADRLSFPDALQDCTGVVSAVEQLKCRAQSLQQQVLALEKDVDRVKEAAGKGVGLPSHHIAVTQM